jgi:phosphatidylinositol alpha-mannosyltransferase
VAGYDWSVVAERILAVYETVAPPGGIGVTASAEDDAALLGVPPAAGQLGPGTAGPFRRRVRR